MNSKSNYWTKEELQTYILLLCANADSIETEEEINLIKSKTDADIFDKIYQEFSNDDDETRFDKIDENIQKHEYSNIELATFRREMHEIFFSDDKYHMMEKNLDRIMDNILY
jgi:phosphopantothenoylcysteine synthetase/decarboxylase